MKKFTFFLIMLASVCQPMFSQTAYKEKNEVEIPGRYKTTTEIEYTYKYVDGEKVYNGPFKINDNFDLEYLSDFNSGRDIYTLSASYKDGWLNGTFTMSHKENYSFPDWDYDDLPIVLVNSSSSFSAKFINGVPDGALKLQYSIKGDYLFSYSGGSRYAQPDINKISLTCSFKKGILVGAFSLKTKEGLNGKEDVVTGTFTSDGKMTGKWSADGETSNFLNGVHLEHESYDADLKSLAKKLGEGKLTIEQLQKDYCVVVYEEENDLLDLLEDVIVAENIIIPWNEIKGYDFTSVDMPPVQNLKYLPSVTEEGMKMLVESVQELDVVDHQPDSYFNDGDYACKYITCKKSEGVSNHCVHVDWSDYGYNESVKIYLTNAQYERLRSEFATKYEEYLTRTYKTSFEKSIASSTIRNLLTRMGCSDELLTKYLPMVGYEFCGAQRAGDAYVISNKINVENKSGVGYKTFKWDLYLDARSYGLDASKTFDAANLVQIPNDYDTINALVDTLNLNSEQIKKAAELALSESKESYENKRKAVTVIDHDDLKATIAGLEDFIKAQAGAVAWMGKSAEANAKEEELLSICGQYQDVLKAYKNIRKGVDLAWNHENDTTGLQNLIDIQAKTVVFVEKRKTIDANDELILSKAPAFSNLKAAYQAYLHASDLSMSADIDYAELDGVIEVQNRTLPFIDVVVALSQENDAIKKAAERHRDVLSAYAAYIDANDELWTPAVDDALVRKMKTIQENTLRFIGLRDKIAKNDADIKSAGETAPSILNPYLEFAAAADLAWTGDVDLAKLQKYIALQEKTIILIANNAKIVENTRQINEQAQLFEDLVAAYAVYIGSDIVWTPEVDIAATEKILDVQARTMEFIELRKTVIENDRVLKDISSAGKGLYKLYTTYRKSADLAWTPEVDMTSLQTLYEVQEDCKTMLKRSDIKELCKNIKKAKIKDVKVAIEQFLK